MCVHVLLLARSTLLALSQSFFLFSVFPNPPKLVLPDISQFAVS